MVTETHTWTPEERMDTVMRIVQRVMARMPRSALRLDLMVALQVLRETPAVLTQNQREIDNALGGEGGAPSRQPPPQE